MWRKEPERHAMASRGIRTINMGLNPFEGDKIPNFTERFGFNVQKTVVHGTSLENAKKIKEDGWLRNGTFVHPGFGGLTDTYNWAKNSFTNPVVIMVEIDTDKPIRKKHYWITIGKHASEREGMDDISEPLKIKKMIVFSVPKEKGETDVGSKSTKSWYRPMKEIKI